MHGTEKAESKSSASLPEELQDLNSNIAAVEVRQQLGQSLGQVFASSGIPLVLNCVCGCPFVRACVIGYENL